MADEVPGRCHVCGTPTMVLMRDRRRYHRSLYFTLYGVAAEGQRAWQAIPADQRRVPWSMHVVIEGLGRWLEDHPTRERSP